MPEIGNPNRQANPFGQIKMADKSRLPGNPQKQDLGKQLNRISGVKEDSQFVDAKKHNQLDKHAFLKLLSNQLQNQDPFKPVDQKKFAADLAQFSQLEQMANMNTKLDKAFKNGNGQDKFMGASFLGKTVQTSGMSVKHNGESRDINLPFHLSKPAKKIMVRVYDSANNMIQQMDKTSMGRGSNSVVWDGYQLDGTPAVKGDYRFEVTAWDEQFNQFKGETKSEGTVTGVTFEGDEMVLVVDGSKKVFLRDVQTFSMPKQKHPAAKSAALNQAATQNYNNIKGQTH